MGRRVQNEPDRATSRRQALRLSLPREKREELERALRQRIRGLLISVMQAGARYYSPVEMVEFIEAETADLRATAEGKERVANRGARQPLKEIHVHGFLGGEAVVTDNRSRVVEIGEWKQDTDGSWTLVLTSKGFTLP